MGKQYKFLLMAGGIFFVLLGCSVFLCFLPQAPLRAVELWLESRIGTDLFSYYTAQLSLTFITISVMTVLSEKNVIIYWENIAESRLIKPTFGCFAAFSWYSIIANIGSAIGVFLKSCTVFSVFFVANILVLILLTNAIIDVYYGKDTKKKQLVKQLKKDYKKHLAADNDCMDGYTQKILGLQYRVRQLHLESDLLELNEIYQLYQQEYALFDTTAAKPFTESLAQSFDQCTSGLFITMLTNIVSAEEQRTQDVIRGRKGAQSMKKSPLSHKEIEELLVSAPQLPREENPCKDALAAWEKSCPFRDCELWMALIHTRALKQWVAQVDIIHMSNPFYHDMTRLIKRRLVSIYNRFICHACLSKGHPEFIDSLLIKWTASGSVVWDQDGSDADPDMLTAFINIAFAHMERSVFEDDPLYVMWHIIRDFYTASNENPNVGLFSGEYRDFPIPDFMLHWSYNTESALLYTIMGKKQPK